MHASYNSCFGLRNKSCLPFTTLVVRLDRMNLGGRVKQERERLKLSQPQLSEKVKMSQQRLGALESRDSKTSDCAGALADALGVSLRWLLTGEGRPTDKDWPFDRVRRARWDACDDADRGYVQGAVNKALEECELNRAQAEPEKRQSNGK